MWFGADDCGSSLGWLQFVTGKGNKERLVPLPQAFAQVFGLWLKDRPKEAFVFAQQPGPAANRPPCKRRAVIYGGCGTRPASISDSLQPLIKRRIKTSM
jgi:integrase